MGTHGRPHSHIHTHARTRTLTYTHTHTHIDQHLAADEARAEIEELSRTKDHEVALVHVDRDRYCKEAAVAEAEAATTREQLEKSLAEMEILKARHRYQTPRP